MVDSRAAGATKARRPPKLPDAGLVPEIVRPALSPLSPLLVETKNVEDVAGQSCLAALDGSLAETS